MHIPRSKSLDAWTYSGNLNEQIHYAPHESERSVFTQGLYGTFFELGFKVQVLDYYMNY